MCIVFSIIGRVYWCLRVASLSMFVDGSSYVSFPRPFIICIHVSYILRVRWVTFLLGALCHCPFHHYIHWWCDFTSCWIWADHHSSSCSLFHHRSRFLLLSHPFHFTPCHFLTMTHFQVCYSLCIIITHLIISLIFFIASLLLSYSHWAPSGPWLMRFSVHVAFYTWGHGFLSLGSWA